MVYSCCPLNSNLGEDRLERSKEDKVGAQCCACYGIHWMIGGNKVEDGFREFLLNPPHLFLGHGGGCNMNDIDDGGILGVDMECYAYYEIH